MLKLVDYPNEIIYRGMVLRCKGKYPFEGIVDFLVCETSNSNPYKLITISGYKAGLQYCVFPKESVPEGHQVGLDTNWLVSNWMKWGYFDCPVEEVCIFDSPVPDMYCI